MPKRKDPYDSIDLYVDAIKKKLVDNINRLPRREVHKIEISSQDNQPKTIVCIELYDKLEAPYFLEKDNISHNKPCTKEEKLSKMKFITRNGDGNFSDFNTLERLFKKRLGVNLSPLEKIEQILKRPEFYDQFENPAIFTEKDEMNEVPLELIQKERKCFFQEKKVVLLKSDYDFRVRFFINNNYHFAHTKEEDTIVRKRINLLQTDDDFSSYILQGKFRDFFDNWIEYNSYFLNKALELKDKIKNPKFFEQRESLIVWNKKQKDEQKNSLTHEEDKELHKQIENIFLDKLIYRYEKQSPITSDYGLENFRKIKNKEEQDFNSSKVQQIFYVVDYKERILFPDGIKDNNISTSSNYFLQIRLNDDVNFLLPALDFLDKRKETGFQYLNYMYFYKLKLYYIVKASNEYKIYELYCKKFKFNDINYDTFFRLNRIHFFLYVSKVLIFETTQEKEEFVNLLDKQRKTNILNNTKRESETNFTKLSEEKQEEVYFRMKDEDTKRRERIIDAQFKKQFGEESFNLIKQHLAHSM